MVFTPIHVKAVSLTSTSVRVLLLPTVNEQVHYFRPHLFIAYIQSVSYVLIH
jgi:hypothetical protein